MRRAAPFTVLALAVACSPDRIVKQSAPSAAAPAASAGALPTVTAYGLQTLAARQGAKAVMVNVWASWCGSCKHELPMLDALAAEYRKRGVLLVTITVDEPEALGAARELVAELKLALPTYRLGQHLSDFKQAMNPEWPGMLPASFLYDATGKLRYYWGGEAFEHELRPILDGLLAGKPIDGKANFGLAPGATSGDH